jgi:hypothetical protein
MLDSHLKASDFLQFIDQGLEGCADGPLEQHLTTCPECLKTLDMILLAEVKSDLSEELSQWRLLELTPQELLERLRPYIAASQPTWNS